MVDRTQLTLEHGGATVSASVTRTNDGGLNQLVALNVAKAGTLSTRTDNTTGTLTLGASHGIATSDLVDVYWDGGSRYNVVVGTVSGTSVPISGGAGDNLPTAATAIRCAKQVSMSVSLVGSQIKNAFAHCRKRWIANFYDGSTLRVTVRRAEGVPWMWDSDISDAAYAMASWTITSIKATMDYTGADEQLFRCGFGIDSAS